MSNNIYNGMKFNGDQMEQIHRGLEAGLDVSIYAKPELHPNQMFAIYHGLMVGLDMTDYAKVEYDSTSIRIIINILKNNIDISKYDIYKYVKEFSYMKRHEILLGIASNIDIAVYTNHKFGEAQMREIRKGLEKGLEASIYAKVGLASEKMYFIRKSLEYDINIDTAYKYINENYNRNQYMQIVLGIKNNLNVNIFANPKYTSADMSYIRLCLEKGYDITHMPGKIKDNKFQIDLITNNIDISILKENQIKELKMGSAQNIDISAYSNPKYNALQMSIIRKYLINGMDCDIIRKYISPDMTSFAIDKKCSDILVANKLIGYLEQLI